MAKKTKEIQDEPLEKKLWKAADKLRKNMDAAEYKHVVLGLIFLKYSLLYQAWMKKRHMILTTSFQALSGHTGLA